MLYLTISNFTKNALWESAAACAFGFIFSFIPISLIIFAVLLGVLRVYPESYNFILSFSQELGNFVDIHPMLNTLIEIKSINVFNIFLGVWVIWMARKLFQSIISSMGKVFRPVYKRKTWFNQLLTFIIEFTLTLLVAVVIITAFAFSQLLELPFFQDLFRNFPAIYSTSSHNIGVLILYFILFVSTTIAYRIISGTKPLIRRCVFYAALSTVAFFIVSYFINLFMNVTKYNTIYGTISSLVILMMKVYLFFVIFLFCAQMIYVSQFFDTLLRSEIYQLPPSGAKGIGAYLRRFLFINPSEIQTEKNTVRLSAGQVLYSSNQKIEFVYYIKSGSISEASEHSFTLRTQGSFLGDVQCIIGHNYQTTATALTDCELISFSSQEFMQILEKNLHATRKAISKISDYTSTIYTK